MGYQDKPVRRSQLMGPWGVGAIVPFPGDESLMIAGLDMWRYSNPADFLIKDERLQKRLGVSELRWPPDYRTRSEDPENCNLFIPAVRFPAWHYCPFCGTMTKAGPYTAHPKCTAYPWEHGRKCTPNAKYKRDLVPERFVVVCPNGHIEDFPVAQWLHSGDGHPYNRDTCTIKRSTGGMSASLSGVKYECSCGVKRSIAGALHPGALGKIGFHCHGARPWLGITYDNEHPCDCDTSKLRVVQRGATNVWFPDTKSSIYIPVGVQSGNRRILALLDEFYDSIMRTQTNGKVDRNIINMLALTKGVDGEELYKAVLQRAIGQSGRTEPAPGMTEDEYRLAEYSELVKNSGNAEQEFYCRNKPVTDYSRKLLPFFKSISLVPKLRETRALVGFSRLEPNARASIAEMKKTLRLGSEDWLPAIEVFGEGIFFEFSKEALDIWAAKLSVTKRIQPMNHSYQASWISKAVPGNLRPQFVLLHTFAHLLINQLSFECGYGSSSIRERVYCERCNDEYGMCGVLLYTASGDSEGSLGGLVRQGEPGRLEDTVLDAIETARWCSADPICIQSGGQGPDSVNLAACHNCALLPETCCELGNRLLDRGLVIGTLEQPDIGFFSPLSR